MNFAILGTRGYPSTYSGYETLVRHLAPYLAEAGHRVTVYGRSQPDWTDARQWEVNDVRCIKTIGIRSKSLSTLSFGLSSATDALFRHFDAALVLNIANGFWLPLLQTSVPAAVNTDGLEWKRGKWNRFAKSVFHQGARFTARYATELIADSTVIRDIWRAEFARDSTFIPYGAPILDDVGNGELDQLGLRGRKYALVVARLVPENNIDLALDALEILADNDMIGVVVGSGVGPSPIESRLRAMTTEGRLIWPGHIENQALLDQLWTNCAVYIHGHSVGGTNPSLLQAMGAGAPTLALDTPFNAEVIRDAGQLYRADPHELANRIESLLLNADLRADIAARQRRRIADFYSWDEVCAGYLSVLERIARN
jgi:glycosyltransferase involved in cell wall biosynthesis